MELLFTPEQEERLTILAHRDGQPDATEFLKQTALRLLEQEDHFRSAVDEAKSYAERDEFIEELEMDLRFKAMIRS